MGKIQEFDITLYNNKVVYGPGESVSGTVKIRTNSALQCKGKNSARFCSVFTCRLAEARGASDARWKSNFFFRGCDYGGQGGDWRRAGGCGSEAAV